LPFTIKSKKYRLAVGNSPLFPIAPAARKRPQSLERGGAVSLSPNCVDSLLLIASQERPLKKTVWSSEDNDRLKAMAAQNVSAVPAASRLKRTIKSVHVQARKLGVRFPTMTSKEIRPGETSLGTSSFGQD
jgi:hypothetical protein